MNALIGARFTFAPSAFDAVLLTPASATEPAFCACACVLAAPGSAPSTNAPTTAKRASSRAASHLPCGAAAAEKIMLKISLMARSLRLTDSSSSTLVLRRRRFLRGLLGEHLCDHLARGVLRHLERHCKLLAVVVELHV